MNLYEIDREVQKLIEVLDETAEANEGVLDEELLQRLDAMQIERQTKLLNLRNYIANSEAAAEALDNEAKDLRERAVRVRKRIERVKRYVAQSLGEGQKFEHLGKGFSWRKSTSVEIVCEQDIPPVYTRLKEEVILDRLAIGQALKGGNEVPGAKLNTKQNLQVL